MHHPLALLLILLILLRWPSPAQASSHLILLTEVHPAPTAGSEWVELYNPSPTPVDLTGWTLSDQLTTPSTLYTLSQVLEPNTTLVIYLATAKLNNSADGVTLQDALGQTIDSMNFTSSTNDQSWSRAGASEPATWYISQPTPNQFNPNQLPPSPTPSPQTSPTPTPTPPPTPSVPTPTPTPASSLPADGVILTISEIGACPETGQSEWVELHNPGEAAVALQNWLIQDASGNTELIRGTIPASGYSVFFWSRSLLNNSGDSVYLLDEDSQIVDSVVYGACTSGMSMTVTNGTATPATPTPGKHNATGSTTGTQASPTPDPAAAANQDATETFPTGSPNSLTFSQTSPPSHHTPVHTLQNFLQYPTAYAEIADQPLSETVWWPPTNPPANTAAPPPTSPPPATADLPTSPDSALLPPPASQLPTSPSPNPDSKNGIIGGLLALASGFALRLAKFTAYVTPNSQISLNPAADSILKQSAFLASLR